MSSIHTPNPGQVIIARADLPLAFRLAFNRLPYPLPGKTAKLRPVKLYPDSNLVLRRAANENGKLTLNITIAEPPRNISRVVQGVLTHLISCSDSPLQELGVYNAFGFLVFQGIPELPPALFALRSELEKRLPGKNLWLVSLRGFNLSNPGKIVEILSRIEKIRSAYNQLYLDNLQLFKTAASLDAGILAIVRLNAAVHKVRLDSPVVLPETVTALTDAFLSRLNPEKANLYREMRELSGKLSTDENTLTQLRDMLADS